jgi:hypothetical protein
MTDIPIRRPDTSRHTEAIVAGILGIPVGAVTMEQVTGFAFGEMDEGACCVNWRPGRGNATTPATSLSGPYTLLWCDRPRALPTDLITGGGDE